MFERYTERARRAIFYARWWALQRGLPIDSSDLILGIAHEPHAVDCPFRWMHDGQSKFIALFAEGLACVKSPENAHIPLSNSSKKALAYAVEEARIDGRYAIDVDHLFRGVLRTGDPTACKLVSANYTLQTLREGSKEAHRRIPDAAPKFRWQANLGYLRWWLRQNRISLWIIALLLCALALDFLHSQN